MNSIGINKDLTITVNINNINDKHLLPCENQEIYDEIKTLIC